MNERAEERIAPTHTAGPSVQSLKDLVVQLFTITAGVLIALSLEGLLEWNNHRLLVREAKATIAREIADNKTELERYLTGTNQRMTNVVTSLQLANELLTAKKSDIREVRMQSDLSSLSSAGWHTAERTNALVYMDYADVQEYSKLYDFQNIYVSHQQRVLDRMLSAVSRVTGDDPRTALDPLALGSIAHKASTADLERFREELQALGVDLLAEDQLGKLLSERYKEMLARR